MTSEQIDALRARVKSYYAATVTGGALHIVLDDGNWERHHIEWCRKYALEENDPEGASIADGLLKMPDALLNLAEERFQDERLMPEFTLDALFDEWKNLQSH